MNISGNQDGTDWAEKLGKACVPVVTACLLAGTTFKVATGTVDFIPSFNLTDSKKSERITDANHPIAIAIGCAEGTRTKGGGKTSAYFSHRDPGDGRQNKGTFSASAGRGNGTTSAMTPEEADKNYIGNLNRYMDQHKFEGDRFQVASFYDLGVQAPATLKDYVANIRAGQSTLEARVNAFRRPDGSIDAAGFGHSEQRLTIDQQRRIDRISGCLG